MKHEGRNFKRDADGKILPTTGIWNGPPWVVDKDYAKKMRAIGGGPDHWYRMNFWNVDIKEVHPPPGSAPGTPCRWKVGSRSRAVTLPVYQDGGPSLLDTSILDGLETDPRRRKGSPSKKFIEGPILDPAYSRADARKAEHDVVVVGDLRKASRSVEMLGMIACNPGIRMSQLRMIYNTDRAGIMRLMMLLSVYGVKFSGVSQGQFKVAAWGVFDEVKIKVLFHATEGLEAMVSLSRIPLDGISDRRTGALDRKAIMSQMKLLWEERLAKENKEI